MKFKQGDKVKCIKENDEFFGRKGEIYTVKSCNNNDVLFEEMSPFVSRVDPERFEKVEGHFTLTNEMFDKIAKDLKDCHAFEEETDLNFLINTANQGLRAEEILLNKYIDKIERKNNNDDDSCWHTFSINPYKGHCVYREKLKPKFVPFWIGKKTCCGYDPVTKTRSGHSGPCTSGEFLVELKNDKIYISNFVFPPNELKNTLTLLCRKNFSEINRVNELYVSSRNGIQYRLLDNCIDLNISWKDCDKILEALEKAGF